MTKENKGNGESQPSQIVIEFTGPGMVDRINIKAEGIVTQGQFGAAAMQLLGMALFDIFGGMQAQIQQRLQQEAIMRDAVQKVTESKQ